MFWLRHRVRRGVRHGADRSRSSYAAPNSSGGTGQVVRSGSDASTSGGRLPCLESHGLGIRSLVVHGLAVLALFGGCSAGGDGSSDAAPDGLGGASSATAIRFVPDTTLRLAPGAREGLTVVVEPAGFSRVEFSLLVGTTAAFDGYLEAPRASTDNLGTARNAIVGPTQPATFVIRAEVADEVFADRAVSVSAEGYGTAVVVPKYAGKRETGTWVASGRAGVTCAELGTTWEDGPLVAEGASEVTLGSLPVGPVVAITVRSARNVGGCATLDGLLGDETRRLEIAVTDRPIQLASGTLDLELDLNEATNQVGAFFDEASARGVSAYRGSHTSDRAVLLADMEREIKSETDRALFVAKSTAENYLGELANFIGDSTISNELGSLLDEAAGGIGGPAVFVGELELGTAPVFFLERAAGASPELSGFLGAERWSVTQEAGDLLVMGGPLTFEPTRWLAALAELPDDEPSPPQRLEEAIDCTEIAEHLTSLDGEELYPGCGVDCAAELCLAALIRGWGRVQSISPEFSTLTVGVSAQVTVNETAAPETLDGTWVGAILNRDATLAGAARGELGDD